MSVAIAASQMQAKLPARVKVDKITYWLAYRRVQIEILVVGKEHLLHLINGQMSQKRSASFQPFKFNGIAENLRWHAPKSWQLEIHFRDASNGSVAHSSRSSAYGLFTGISRPTTVHQALLMNFWLAVTAIIRRWISHKQSKIQQQRSINRTYIGLSATCNLWHTPILTLLPRITIIDLQQMTDTLCSEKSAPLNMSKFLQKYRPLFNYHLTA